MHFLRFAALASFLIAPNFALAEDIPPVEPINPTPFDHCKCITVAIDGKVDPDYPGIVPIPVKTDDNGGYKFDLLAIVGTLDKNGQINPDPVPDPCSDVRITKIEVKSRTKSGTQADSKATSPGNVCVVQVFPPADNPTAPPVRQYPGQPTAIPVTVPIPVTIPVTITGGQEQSANTKDWVVVVTVTGRIDTV